MTDTTDVYAVCAHGQRGYCPRCALEQLHTTPGPVLPMGCICPAGANRECENPMCPRKPMRFNISSTSAVPG